MSEHEQPCDAVNKESGISCSSGEFQDQPYLPERLIRALIEFILKSTKLHTVIIDSVKIHPELFLVLGEALSATSSGLRTV